MDMYFPQKDSNAVKEALDQLSEVGWAKRWSSQPYVSRRTVSQSPLSVEVLGMCHSKHYPNLQSCAYKHVHEYLFAALKSQLYVTMCLDNM